MKRETTTTRELDHKEGISGLVKPGASLDLSIAVFGGLGEAVTSTNAANWGHLPAPSGPAPLPPHLREAPRRTLPPPTPRSPQKVHFV